MQHPQHLLQLYQDTQVSRSICFPQSTAIISPTHHTNPRLLQLLPTTSYSPINFDPSPTSSGTMLPPSTPSSTRLSASPSTYINMPLPHPPQQPFMPNGMPWSPNSGTVPAFVPGPLLPTDHLSQAHSESAGITSSVVVPSDPSGCFQLYPFSIRKPLVGCFALRHASGANTVSDQHDDQSFWNQTSCQNHLTTRTNSMSYPVWNDPNMAPSQPGHKDGNLFASTAHVTSPTQLQTQAQVQPFVTYAPDQSIYNWGSPPDGTVNPRMNFRDPNTLGDDDDEGDRPPIPLFHPRQYSTTPPISNCCSNS